MGNINLNSLMKDYRRFNNYEEAVRLANKWEKTGLLEGIDKAKEHEYLGMARLLENEARHLIDESVKTGTTAGSEEWSNVALPLVRRTFGKLASKEIISIQPMAMPSGLVFWLDFKYGTTKPTNTTIFSSSQLVYGDPETGTGPYYDMDFGYTKNYVSASTVAATCVSASWADFKYSSDMSASIAANPNDFKKLTVTGSALTNVDLDAINAINITDTNIDTVYRSYTSKDSSNNLIFLVSGAHDVSLTTVEYLSGNTEYSRGDFEAGQTGVGAIPEVSLSLRQEPVLATTRKLKAKWTPELQQDLNAYHALDAEAELTNLMSEQISLEIDMENLLMLVQNASLKDFWSAKVGQYVSETDGSYASGSFFGTQMQWYQTFVQKLTKMSNRIYKRNLRIPANFVVISPEVATILESMKDHFVADGALQNDLEYSLGITKMGTLANRWTIYKNVNFRKDVVLVGAKGNSFLDTGAVFAPYIGLMVSDKIYDPDTAEPIKFSMTRGAKKMVRNFMYGIIYVRDLDLV